MAFWTMERGSTPNPAQAFDVAAYWNRRYAAGGSSGKGSYGRLAKFKAEVINGFAKAHEVSTAIELGCGDGHQFSLFEIPRYVGLDVSENSIAHCRQKFSGRTDCEFHVSESYPKDAKFDLALSLDVIFHLVQDQIFVDYMRHLFNRAERFIIIYSSNRTDLQDSCAHVRHRRFTDWIEQNAVDWALLSHIPNRFPRWWLLRQDRSFSDFYIYARRSEVGHQNG
jgi:2-polyprenyl-3-methyl-5-hydroxy-6-metoxy-1,4-benzoquinol methylase